MGACSFVNAVKRKDAKSVKEAFKQEVERSQYESGRSYSGEIGMKHDFVRARNAKECKTLREAIDEADRLIDEHGNSMDKWGPAFFIEVEGDEGGWVFFGFASS